MMLSKDRERFETAFPGASAFMRAAMLRYEAFVLSRKPSHLLTPWETERLENLIALTPACQEDWFLDIIKHDGSSWARELCAKVLS